MNTPPLDVETYEWLRRLANRVLGGGSHTLQPTALLHEAWMKLEVSTSKFRSREHFLAVAATAMRQILVNHARGRAAQKRGGNLHRTTLSGVGELETVLDVLALDAALSQLDAADPKAAKVVLLRVFGGMSIPEVAQFLDTSERSVSRAWRFARAFLKSALDEPSGH